MAISVLARAPIVLYDQSVGQVLLKIFNYRPFVVFLYKFDLFIRVVVTGCENLHENGVLRVTIMPQTRHSSKFSGHVFCPDFLDRVSVLFTASVAPSSCFSTTTKGMGKESISPLGRRLLNQIFFHAKGPDRALLLHRATAPPPGQTANIHL